jgi:hypothetical protein
MSEQSLLYDLEDALHDANFSGRENILTMVADLRIHAEFVAQAIIDDKNAANEMDGRRLSNLSRDTERAFNRDGTTAKLKALYAAVHKDRADWVTFPEELRDLRRFISAPFRPYIDSAIRSNRSNTLKIMRSAARSAALKLCNNESPFKSYRAWSAGVGIDQRVARKWWTEKHSQFRLLLCGEIKRIRRKSYRTRRFVEHQAWRSRHAVQLIDQW